MAMKMKKESLKGLPMPKKAKDPMLEVGPEADELDMPGSDEEQAHPGAGKETPAEESKELQAMPDEDLVKELEARGFTVEKPEEEAAEQETASDETSESPEEDRGY